MCDELRRQDKRNEYLKEKVTRIVQTNNNSVRASQSYFVSLTDSPHAKPHQSEPSQSVLYISAAYKKEYVVIHYIKFELFSACDYFYLFVYNHCSLSRVIFKSDFIYCSNLKSSVL